MKQGNSYFQSSNSIKGVYGDFIVTSNDKKSSLLPLINSFLWLILFNRNSSMGYQWISSNWIWLLGMSISMGLSLKWIHIYLRPLHQTLTIFWVVGSIGFNTCISLWINKYHYG